jgi:hypothetical protein
MKTTTQTFENVTLYAPLSVMGTNIVKVECRSLRIEVRPHAQFAAAVHVYFVPKGSRRERFHVETSRPAVVVLDGYKQMDPDGVYDPALTTTTGDVTVMRSRYLSCDPRWQGDFDAKLAAYVAEGKGKIVADFRGHDPGDGKRDYSKETPENIFAVA